MRWHTPAYLKNIKWDRELKNNLRRKKKTNLIMATSEKLRTARLLPRIVMLTISLYNENIKWIAFFPDSSSENRVICVPGTGSKNRFLYL